MCKYIHELGFLKFTTLQNDFDLIVCIGIETSLSPEPAFNKDSAFRATFFGISPGDFKIPVENKGRFNSSQSFTCFFSLLTFFQLKVYFFSRRR